MRPKLVFCFLMLMVWGGIGIPNHNLGRAPQMEEEEDEGLSDGVRMPIPKTQTEARSVSSTPTGGAGARSSAEGGTEGSSDKEGKNKKPQKCECLCKTRDVRGNSCTNEKAPQRLCPPKMGNVCDTKAESDWKFIVELPKGRENCREMKGESCSGLASEANMPANQNTQFQGKYSECEQMARE